MKRQQSLFQKFRNRKNKREILEAMKAEVEVWIKKNTKLSLSVGEFSFLWETLEPEKLESMSLFVLGRTIQFRATVGWATWLNAEHLESVRTMLRPFIHKGEKATRKGAA